MTSLLNTKMSFEIAALIVSWLAIALLAFAVGNLLVRLRRLEQTMPTPQTNQPYSQLLGQPLHELLGEFGAGPQPRALFFLSSTCKSCTNLLRAIRAQAWDVPISLVWTDGAPEAGASFPFNVTARRDGASLSAALGISVTPFVIVANADGRIIKAGPVHSLKSLGNLVAEPANFQRHNLTPNHLKEVSR